MIGRKLAHYEVLAPLGKGGMGEVYRARDTKLGREVAIKILPPELNQDPGRRARFEREAQTVAALNHPNVVTLHAVEEAEGISFLVMELVEGQTLDQVVPQGGLELPRFLHLAEPLCEAVAAAHAKGITHRDLKPQNVMLDRDGRIRVLDFGLAKILESAWQVGDATLDATAPATREGAIVGTAAYMSPEQAEGLPVDARSDVFSLGVLLYEMLTGKRAFQGETHLSTLTAVLRDQPRGVLELRPDLPRQLARILRRCLEKDPERRYESARGLRYDLEILREELQSGEWQPAPAGASGPPSSPEALAFPSAPATESSSGTNAPPSGSGDAQPRGVSNQAGAPRRFRPIAIVAVLLVVVVAAFLWTRGRELGSSVSSNEPEQAKPATARAAEPTIVVFPFQNLGPPEDAYFAAGITDEILTSLIQVEGLRVLSRTSSQQYDRSGKTMQQIADDLGVDYVLEGTVRWQKSETGPSRVRVIPQLVAAHEDEQVWGERYDRSMDEIFAVQTEIAEEVVRQLGGALAMNVGGLEPEVPTEDMEAYHAYLRAKSIVDGTRYTLQEWRLAVQLFERAVELDPSFHLAWAQLARTQAGICHFGWDRSEQRLAASLSAVHRAEELAPDDAITHMARGYYHYWGLKEFGPAIDAFHAAQVLRPKDPEIILALAYVQRRQGRFQEALEGMLRASEYSPKDGALAYHIAETYAILGNYEEADRWTRRGLVLEPDRAISYSFAVWEAVLSGESSRAHEILTTMPIHSDPEVWAQCVHATYHLGDFATALEYSQKLPEYYESQYYSICRELETALIYEAMDRHEQARESFEAAERLLAAKLEADPRSSNLNAAHALCLAGLGRKEEALRQVGLSMDLFPADKDLWIRSWRVYDQLHVQILVGEYDEAMETLERLMSTPTDAMSPAMMRRSPVLDPLRDREDFAALLRAQS